MKKIIVLVVLLLIGPGILFIPVQSGFYITENEEHWLYFLPDKEEKITIGWRHSVELTPWEENYRVIENGNLTLDSTIYKAYGAGTPDVEGKAEILSNGYIKVTGIERIIPEYSLFYIPISGYYIKHNEEKFELKGLVSDYERIQIKYGKLQLYKWVYLKFNATRQKVPTFLQ